MVIAGNYRGVFRYLVDDLDVPGVRVLWPRLSTHDARVLVQRRLPADVESAVLTAVAASGALLSPLASALAAVVDLGRALIRWRSERLAADDLPALFRSTLRQAAAEQATIFLLDAVDEPERSVLWNVAYLTTLQTPVAELLVIAGIDSDERVTGFEARTRVRSRIRDLAERGAIALVDVPPLDLARMHDWLGPVSFELGERLLALSGRDDAAAAAIWDRWKNAKHVVRRVDGTWVTTATRDPIEDDIDDALVKRLGASYVIPARSILAIASLWGRQFCGNEVASVAADVVGLRVEQVEDVLDSLAPGAAGDPWLLSEPMLVRSSADGTPHWRYRFASGQVARHLRDGVGAQRAELCRLQLLEAMDAHGEGHELGPSMAALAGQIDADTDARRLWSSAEAHATVAAFGIHAPTLLHLAELAPSTYVCSELCDAAALGIRLGLIEVAVRLARKAVDVARIVGDTQSLARSTYRLGAALDHAGLAAAAIAPLSRSVQLGRALLETAPSVRLQGDLANSLWALGSALTSIRGFSSAIEYLQEALDHCQQVLAASETPSHRLRLIVILRDLGYAHMALDELAGARNVLEMSLSQARRLSADAPSALHSRELAASLGTLAKLLLRVGGIDEASPAVEEALAVMLRLAATNPTPEHRLSLARAHADVGELRSMQRNLDGAVRHYESGIEIVREVASIDNSLDKQSLLGSLLADVGRARLSAMDAAGAVGPLAEATEIHRHVYRQHPNNATRATFRRTLSDAYTARKLIGDDATARQLEAEADALGAATDQAGGTR